MASIAMMIGGTVLNAAAFTVGNYLAKYLAGDDGQAALAEKTRHDKALEAYNAAMEKYTLEHTQLLDWIETNREIKAQANQNFTNTDCAFKFYNQAHPDYKLTQPTAPKFSDMYQPSELQKQGKLLFCRRGRASAWIRGFSFPLNIFRLIKMDSKLAKIYYSPQGYWKGVSATKKLAESAKVPENVVKQWLCKQAIWQIYLPAPQYVPRPKFDVATPNSVHQADLFLPHDKLPRGKRCTSMR